MDSSPKTPEPGLTNAEGVACKLLKAPVDGPGIEPEKVDEVVALGVTGAGEGDLLSSSLAIESRARNCADMEKAGVEVNGDGAVDVSVVFDGIAEGVLGSGDSAGFPNKVVVPPKGLDSACLDESPIAQTGFAAGPPFDAAVANALWVPDANAPKPNDAVDCWVLGKAEGLANGLF